MTEKPYRPVTPGIENTVASLRNRIDELETLLREKESGKPSDKSSQDVIPVLDEVISLENAGHPQNDDNDIFEPGNGRVPDEDRIAEIINKLDKQINNDLEALIKLLKHSIMKEIKTTLMTDLTQKQSGQYPLDIDEKSGPEKHYRRATDRDSDR